MRCGAGAAEPEITIIGSQACKQAKATAPQEEKRRGREFDTVISRKQRQWRCGRRLVGEGRDANADR